MVKTKKVAIKAAKTRVPMSAEYLARILLFYLDCGGDEIPPRLRKNRQVFTVLNVLKELGVVKVKNGKKIILNRDFRKKINLRANAVPEAAAAAAACTSPKNTLDGDSHSSEVAAAAAACESPTEIPPCDESFNPVQSAVPVITLTNADAQAESCSLVIVPPTLSKKRTSKKSSRGENPKVNGLTGVRAATKTGAKTPNTPRKRLAAGSSAHKRKAKERPSVLPGGEIPSVIAASQTLESPAPTSLAQTLISPSKRCRFPPPIPVEQSWNFDSSSSQTPSLFIKDDPSDEFHEQQPVTFFGNGYSSDKELAQQCSPVLADGFTEPENSACGLFYSFDDDPVVPLPNPSPSSTLFF